MEKRDLYDINRNLTGETIYKGEKIPKDRYIVVVLSFIQNSKGEFLIQKRSPQKDGKYASTGGHAKTGETSMQAIITEIKEELGLDVDEKELELVYSGREDRTQVFFDIYYMKKDFEIEDLKLQKEEVDFVEIAGIAYRGNFYAILQPVELLDGMEEDEALVFKVTRGKDGEDKFEIELDDAIIDAVFEEYNKLLDDAEGEGNK